LRDGEESCVPVGEQRETGRDEHFDERH
jgi:hypothetical protein